MVHMMNKWTLREYLINERSGIETVYVEELCNIAISP